MPDTQIPERITAWLSIRNLLGLRIVLLGISLNQGADRRQPGGPVGQRAAQDQRAVG
ncbi:hypothetical protein ACJU26_04090 [Acidithiobacillus sp. M4-SHS-6]|uniref:hypothetical protein n=1 Tax=Acidithiobacillus sp. M4-SHS-6 TaxID=3383024 RepID=UPI0039BE30E0